METLRRGERERNSLKIYFRTERGEAKDVTLVYGRNVKIVEKKAK